MNTFAHGAGVIGCQAEQTGQCWQLLPGHQPQGVDHAGEEGEQRQQAVEPEMQAEAHLHERCHWREEDGDQNLDQGHVRSLSLPVQHNGRSRCPGRSSRCRLVSASYRNPIMGQNASERV
jgi:hypothetical protein